jgi:hypothetical protein
VQLSIAEILDLVGAKVRDGLSDRLEETRITLSLSSVTEAASLQINRMAAFNDRTCARQHRRETDGECEEQFHVLSMYRMGLPEPQSRRARKGRDRTTGEAPVSFHIGAFPLLSSSVDRSSGGRDCGAWQQRRRLAAGAAAPGSGSDSKTTPQPIAPLDAATSEAHANLKS